MLPPFGYIWIMFLPSQEISMCFHSGIWTPQRYFAPSALDTWSMLELSHVTKCPKLLNHGCLGVLKLFSIISTRFMKGISGWFSIIYSNHISLYIPVWYSKNCWWNPHSSWWNSKFASINPPSCWVNPHMYFLEKIPIFARQILIFLGETPICSPVLTHFCDPNPPAKAAPRKAAAPSSQPSRQRAVRRWRPQCGAASRLPARWILQRALRFFIGEIHENMKKHTGFLNYREHIMNI